MELKPLHTRLIVLRLPKPPNPSGIYIPDVVTEKSDKGRVLEAGPKCKHIKKGDKVLFTKYAGTEVKVDGVPILVMTEDDIMARLSED